jgi:hypothetical protein
MPTPFDSDIPFLLADLGVPVVVGAVSAKGLFDAADEIVLQDKNGDGGVGVNIPTVTVQASVFPNIKRDDAIQVDGVNWFVRDRLRIEDGSLMKILLSKVRAK